MSCVCHVKKTNKSANKEHNPCSQLTSNGGALHLDFNEVTYTSIHSAGHNQRTCPEILPNTGIGLIPGLLLP